VDSLPTHNPEQQLGVDVSDLIGTDPLLIINTLDGYRKEAQDARRGGPSSRDDTWSTNWDRYWGRYDHSKKADWQSKHVMPESPQFIDRWAAAMREALDAGGEWFTVVDETGQSNELMPHVQKTMKVLLSRCSRTPDGHRADFSSVFEDQMKLGALMMLSASVTWRDDDKGGWVSVESVDPRETWLDPKLRNLYRLRQYTIDLHELNAMAAQTDDEGKSIYDTDALAELTVSHMRETAEKERSSGHGQDESSFRKPITIDEWLCTILDADGEVIADRALVIVANEKHVIRGPEENPFWHGDDWLVTTAMIPVPFSAYGRSYMEDWSDVADAFIEMTNLILDGVFTSTMKSFAAIPELLENPQDLDEGMSPNKIFKLAEGVVNIKEFIKEIDLGTLPSEALAVWTALKQELRDGAKLSEIALGQVPPKGGITATEITAVSQSGSAMIRSMARTIESRFLEVVLTLVWQTALQHMDFLGIADEIGEETAQMLNSRKEQFSDAKFVFRVRGISGLIDKQMELQGLLSMLGTVAQNELLMRKMLEKVDLGKLMDKMFQLFGVDPTELTLSPQEQLIAQLTGPQPGADAQPA